MDLGRSPSFSKAVKLKQFRIYAVFSADNFTHLFQANIYQQLPFLLLFQVDVYFFMFIYLDVFSYNVMMGKVWSLTQGSYAPT